MLNGEEFRKYAHQMVDWMADYVENIEQYPVKSQVQPKEIFDQLPTQAPQQSESMEAIWEDFQKIILRGMTHWQSPNFFAYFPANGSYPSLLAEMLMSTMGAQCMIWETSPAAAELEEMVMNWIRDMMGLPKDFVGVIQDTASTATLCAILTARERFTNFQGNTKGLSEFPNLRVYCSKETHSSIDKAVKIAGLGSENLVKVAVDENLAIIPSELEKAIQQDLDNGKTPLCVIAATGSTGTTALDPVRAMGEICQKYKVWFHVDAAYAGTATVVPELRWIIDGVELADSYVFNPHKWMFTNFDCTAYYVKDKEALIRTFSILPEYLKTATTGKVNDYRDWGVPLGRRFRALKLWFVIRNFGVEGIQQKIRLHVELGKKLNDWVEESPDFELMVPTPLNLVCFRYHPSNISDEEELEQLNRKLLDQLNASGKMYLTHTKVKGKYTIRLVVGQTNVTEVHLNKAWELICETAQSL